MRLLPSYVRPLRYGRYIAEMTKKESCLPETYIEKFNYWVSRRTPKHPRYRPVVVGRGNLSFSDDRPWQTSFFMRNRSRAEDFYVVKPLKEWFWFKGDVVEILVGKDKGKQGNIFQIYQERNWVIVRGLNMYLQQANRYANVSLMGADAPEDQHMEAPLHVGTQIALVDPSDLKPTEVEWRYTEEGERVRVSVRTGRVIPMPLASEETHAYKTTEAYHEHAEKDTKKADVVQVTYTPNLRTFEMEIMEEMNIEEERLPKKTYWC